MLNKRQLLTEHYTVHTANRTPSHLLWCQLDQRTFITLKRGEKIQLEEVVMNLRPYQEGISSAFPKQPISLTQVKVICQIPFQLSIMFSHPM